jgi:hypothetical protein
MKKIELNTWYELAERKPPIGQVVLLADPRLRGMVFTMAWRYKRGHWDGREWPVPMRTTDLRYTHWMIPLPPREK